MKLKFRVWKDSPYPHCIVFEKWWLSQSDGDWELNDLFIKENFPDYTVQQFTGLLDKNKREVYEGDILDICGGRFEMIWKNYRWQFKSLDEKDYFMGINDSSNRFVEVIGNIFEPPVENSYKLEYNDLGFPINNC